MTATTLEERAARAREVRLAREKDLRTAEYAARIAAKARAAQALEEERDLELVTRVLVESGEQRLTFAELMFAAGLDDVRMERVYSRTANATMGLRPVQSTAAPVGEAEIAARTGAGVFRVDTTEFEFVEPGF